MATDANMRIATFNANSIRARLPIVIDWLRQHSPDVLCVQETKVVDEMFPRTPFEEIGYHVECRGEKKYNGVAVMTKGEPEDVSFGFDRGRERDETRLARMRYRGVAIVNTYVPQGRDIESEAYAYKLAWFDRLGDMFRRCYSPEEPLVWVGDINVAPEEIDLHNPKANRKHVCFHEDVRKALGRVMRWGFTDVFRKHHPEPGQYTFWDYRAPSSVKKNTGWRIDHVMATAPAAQRSADCFVDREPRLRERPSDHTFLVADFGV